MDGHVSDYIRECIDDVTEDWKRGRGRPISWEDWRLCVEWYARDVVEYDADDVMAHCSAEHPRWDVRRMRETDPVGLGAFLVRWLSTEIAEGMDPDEWITAKGD